MKLQNLEIRFEVTNRCNAHCIMCPREKMKRLQGILDLNLYKRIIDEACENGAQIVSLENYGETFLDPYIFERAEYAKNKGLKVFTITNGSLLSPDICKKIVSYFNKIRISLYGITKETYEKIHKGLSFEKTKNNIENLFSENINKQLRIELYFLLLEENKHEMQEFLRLYENKADAVSIWKPHNWANGRNYRITTDQKFSCGRPINGPLQVQWDGKVVPCCFDYDSQIILGDLNNQTILEILNGDPYKNLRSAHLSNNFLNYPYCNVCDQLNKRDDVLVYTSIKESKVGSTNTAYFNLKDN